MMKIVYWRRFPRFTLKSLLAVMALVCVWCGYYANQAHSRRQALLHIVELGGTTWKQGQITIATTTKPTSAGMWLSRRYEDTVCRLFGDALRKETLAVDLSEAVVSESDIARLTPLDEIRWITLTGPTIDDTAARHFRSFKQLRWLDISGTGISINGVRTLDTLRSLEWLNVSQTRVVDSDIKAIKLMFPKAKFGFSSSPGIAVPPHNVVNSGEVSSSQRSLWIAVKEDPYSKDALKKYISAVGNSTALDFPHWYISSVYRAKRGSMDPLLVIQVYDGTRMAFNLGCLLVFDADGRLLREIPKERVHWSLGGPTTQSNWMNPQTARIRADQQAAASKRLIDLKDLTGDGFDEIPTQRWANAIGTSDLRGESTSIYTSASTEIPCLLCVAFPNRGNSELLVDLGSMDRQLSYRNLKSHKLFLQTPCYATTATGSTLLNTLPQRTLATFYWSDEAGSYLGPTEGPQNAWRMYRR